MEKLSLREIAPALGCRCETDADVTSVVTDSREARPGSLFVALRGERVDGHDYIGTAFERGAVAAIAERPVAASGPVFVVPDSVHALQQVAALYRSRFDVRVIGVTGSVGKTTTKDMIACALEGSFRLMKSQGNRNNEIGSPMTMFDLTPRTQVAVVEMGMSAPGEISDLCRVAKPCAGVITNIGVSHLERLGSRENILKAKLELADALPDGAPLLLCSDNDLLHTVRVPRLKVVAYGLRDPEAAIRGSILSVTPRETAFRVFAGGREYEGSVPGAGEHLVLNALAAFGVAEAFGVPPERALAMLRGYSPSGMRQRVVEHAGFTVVEDCYNASPDSMAAAIRALAQFPCAGRRIFVMSDMLELGEASREGHRSVGTLAARCGLDRLLTWGERSAWAAEAAREAGMTDVFHYDDKGELCDAVADAARPGDILWFKASRGMALEDVIAALYERT